MPSTLEDTKETYDPGFCWKRQSSNRWGESNPGPPLAHLQCNCNMINPEITNPAYLFLLFSSSLNGTSATRWKQLKISTATVAPSCLPSYMPVSRGRHLSHRGLIRSFLVDLYRQNFVWLRSDSRLEEEFQTCKKLLENTQKKLGIGTACFSGWFWTPNT